MISVELKEVKIELTNYCKRNCIHCSSDANSKHLVSLNLTDVKQVIDQCCDIGVNSIVLTGGEATEYPELAEVVAYIHQKGIKEIKLYTMCEPTRQKYELLRQLSNLGLTEIVYSLTISLTTDGAVTYDNVENFLVQISKWIPISFHYCLTKKTVADLDKLKEILSKIDEDHFKALSFLRYVAHGRGKDDLTLSSVDLKELKPKLLEFMKEYPDKIHLGSPFNILDITYTPCTAGEKTMIVGFNGNVYPCDAMKYFDYLGSGGNIYSSGIEEIYYSTYFQEIRNASKNISEECRNCSRQNCQGGCLAQKMQNLVRKTQQGVTTRWYQEIASQKMNSFEDEETLELNACAGVLGEGGEFVDYIKKLYTHNLSQEKRNDIMALAPKELGDLIWYLSVSMAQVYHYTLDEVYEHILQQETRYSEIGDRLIREAGRAKDPLCPISKQQFGYAIDDIYFVTTGKYLGLEKDKQLRLKMVRCFSKILAKLNSVSTKEEAIKAVSEMFVEIAEISQALFHRDLSTILVDNIEKLRKRYPSGFDSDVANLRIEANKQYRQERGPALSRRKDK